MIKLDDLKNTSRRKVRRKRVGRGIGSGLGKTCGRGEKGAGARAGYKTRLGYEGGQMRLFMKLPVRGFSNARFKKKLHIVNLADIEFAFEEGDKINLDTLSERGFLRGRTYGIKVLANGQLNKKVVFEGEGLYISGSAQDKLKQVGIEFPNS